MDTGNVMTDFYEYFKDPETLANILKDIIPKGATTVEPPTPATFGEGLETIRTALGISSHQLAIKLELDPEQIEAYLDNKLIPPPEIIQHITTKL